MTSVRRCRRLVEKSDTTAPGTVARKNVLQGVGIQDNPVHYEFACH